MGAVGQKTEQLQSELRTILTGSGWADRARIATMMVHAHLRFGGLAKYCGWIPSLPDPARQIRLRSGATVTARRADGIVFFEHFGLDVYGLDLPIEPVQTIVDLGANIGFAAIALGLRYPGARLVCVEPFPASRQLLTENLSRNGLAATVIPYAVVGTAGNVELSSEASPGSNRATVTETGSIQGITLDAVLDQAGVEIADLVKIDIEGSELGVFQEAASWAPRVRALIGELHDGLTVERAAEMLGPHGFRPYSTSGPRFEGVACFVKG